MERQVMSDRGDVTSEAIIYGGEEWVSLADHKRLHAALDEAVQIMKNARGHYGIEETSGSGQPATEWDEIADRMQMFVWRWDRAAPDEEDASDITAPSSGDDA